MGHTCLVSPDSGDVLLFGKVVYPLGPGQTASGKPQAAPKMKLEPNWP